MGKIEREAVLEKFISSMTDKFLNSLLTTIIIIAIPLLILTLYPVKYTGFHSAHITNIIVVTFTLILFLIRKRVNFKIKASIILTLLYLVMAMSYTKYGLIANGAGYYIVIPVLATLLFGMRWGISVIAVNIITLILIFLAVYNQVIIFSFDINSYQYTAPAWIISIASLIFWGVILIITADQLYISLLNSLNESMNKTELLEDEIKVRQTAEESLKRKSEFDNVITDILTRIAVCRYEDIDSVISISLQKIAAFYNIDNVHIILYDPEKKLCRICYNWTNSEVPPGTRFPDTFPSGLIPWSVESLFNGNIMLLNKIEEFPPEASVDMELHKNRGTKSILNIPIGHNYGMSAGTGCIGLNSFSSEITWPEDAVNQLKIIGNVIYGLMVKKKIEEALRQSEENYRFIVENAPIGIYRRQLNGNYIYANQVMLDIFECGSYEELTYNYGILTKEWVDDEQYQQFKDILLKKKKLYSYEAGTKLFNGKIKFLSLTAILNEEDSTINGFILDITERKIAEREKENIAEKFQQLQKMESLGHLAAGIAHDFNNILSGILGFSDLAMLKSDKKEYDEIPEYLTEIKQGGLRARDLVKQILTFSRQSRVIREPVEIAPLINETLKLLRASLPANINIKQNIADNGLVLKTDPTQFHQILMNLCSNAAFAMQKDGGIIDVTLTEVTLDKISSVQFPGLIEGKYIRLVVSDTGHGIPEAIISKIFDPFFTTKDRDKGTGMGLSVVHGIITDMKGTISVYSEPGNGTSFHILLPSCDDTVSMEKEKATPIHTGQGKILLVDDEQSIITSGAAILKHLGYDVITANNATMGLEIFKADPDSFHCIITDMNMPGLTGLEFSKQIKLVNEDIPVILCTGFAPGITQEMLDEYSISEMVMKPIIVDELSCAVKKALDSRQNKNS